MVVQIEVSDGLYTLKRNSLSPMGQRVTYATRPLNKITKEINIMDFVFIGLSKLDTAYEQSE